MTKSLTKLDVFVYFIIILNRSQQFPTSSSQNQVELGEWATGHFMHWSFVLILKRNCLVGASRVRCGESGTPSTIIYTRWTVGIMDFGVMLLWSRRAVAARLYAENGLQRNQQGCLH